MNKSAHYLEPTYYNYFEFTRAMHANHMIG